MTWLAWFWLGFACVFAFTAGALFQRVRFYRGLYEHFKESYKVVYAALREERGSKVWEAQYKAQPEEEPSERSK